MNLILITNVPDEINLAQSMGIRTFLIDLERETKIDRQQGKGLFISDHTIDDLIHIRKTFPDIELITRINSWHVDSVNEVEKVLAAGTNAVMLPFIQQRNELVQFKQAVNGRARIIPLFETIWSVCHMEECLEILEADTCHFGLNDLALEQGWSSIFEAFNWTPFVQALSCAVFRGLDFGIAGIGNQLDQSLPVNPQDFFIQQVQHGGSRFWLSRNFRRIFQSPDAENILKQNIDLLTQLYNQHSTQPDKDSANLKLLSV